MASTPEAPPSAALGGTADYSIGPLVGVGLLGPVRRGRYLPTGAAVELEAVPEALRRDAGLVVQVERAARLAAGLRGPVILAAYDLLVDAGGAMYLVTEPAPGERLEDRATEGRGLELPEAMAWIVPVLEALEEVHSGGLAHGGLSRRTVMRTADGRVRLAGVPSAALLGAYQGAAPDAAGDQRAARALLRGLLRDPLRGSQRRPVPRRVRSILDRRHPDVGALRAALVAAVPDRLEALPAHAPPEEPDDSADAAWVRPALVAAGTARPAVRRRWLTRSLLGGVAVAAGVALGLLLNVVTAPSGSSGSLRVSAVSLDVSPAGDACDTSFRFTATGTVDGQGVLVYRWAASGGRTSGERSLAIGAGTRSFAVSEDWRPASTLGQASLSFEVLRPGSLVITRSVNGRCP